MGARNARAEDTRGRILDLLCSSDRTASELARAVGISPNGVRDHMARLERAGLVAHRLVRRGVGKPAHEYYLTDEGSRYLSRAYLPVLGGLLAVVRARGGADAEEALLREAGRVLARRRPRAEGGLRSRVDAAVALLGELGGSATVGEGDGGIRIEGTCCPLRALVPEHPLACKALEAMVEEYVGAPVRERCEKRAPPACRLHVGTAER